MSILSLSKQKCFDCGTEYLIQSNFQGKIECSRCIEKKLIGGMKILPEFLISGDASFQRLTIGNHSYNVKVADYVPENEIWFVDALGKKQIIRV